AIGVVAERVALGLQPPAVVDHRVERRPVLGPRIRLEAGLAERRQRVAVRAEPELAPLAHVIEEDVERPARRDGGVLLAHGRRRGWRRARSGRARRRARCRGRRSSARTRTRGACPAARGEAGPRTRAGRRATWRCRARAWPRGAPPSGRHPRAGRPRAAWDY